MRSITQISPSTSPDFESSKYAKRLARLIRRRDGGGLGQAVSYCIGSILSHCGADGGPGEFDAARLWDSLDELRSEVTLLTRGGTR